MTAAARRSVQALSSSGSIITAAWSTWEKVGQSHAIIFAQISRTQSHPPMKYLHSKILEKFAEIVSNFLRVRQQFGYSNDLFSARIGEIKTTKLPLDMRSKWFENEEKPQTRAKQHSLMDFNT